MQEFLILHLQYAIKPYINKQFLNPLVERIILWFAAFLADTNLLKFIYEDDLEIFTQLSSCFLEHRVHEKV